jgi:hypothetical protein
MLPMLRQTAGPAWEEVEATTTHSGQGIEPEHFSLGRFKVLVPSYFVRQGDQPTSRGSSGGEVSLVVLLESGSQAGFDLGRRETGGEDGAQVGEDVVYCLFARLNVSAYMD